jgi:glycosyltransferase involved in cell wall biosynthesis
MFSLVVPTIGKVNMRPLLDSIVAQNIEDYEVIIVDQGDSSTIQALLKEYNFKSIYINMDGKGVSRARNRGVQEASGDIITFPDDDCWYPSRFLKRVEQILLDRKDIDGVTVSSKDPDSNQSIAKFAKKKCIITRKNVLETIIEFGMFIRKDCMKTYRLDENMGLGAGTPWGSDTGPDLILRMMEDDRVMLYCPELHIYHPAKREINTEEAKKRSYSYSRGRGYFLKKHGYSKLYILRTILRSLAGSIIYLFKGDIGSAKYYFYAAVGKYEGYFKSKNNSALGSKV